MSNADSAQEYHQRARLFRTMSAVLQFTAAEVSHARRVRDYMQANPGGTRPRPRLPGATDGLQEAVTVLQAARASMQQAANRLDDSAAEIGFILREQVPAYADWSFASLGPVGGGVQWGSALEQARGGGAVHQTGEEVDDASEQVGGSQNSDDAYEKMDVSDDVSSDRTDTSVGSDISAGVKGGRVEDAHGADAVKHEQPHAPPRSSDVKHEQVGSVDTSREMDPSDPSDTSDGDSGTLDESDDMSDDKTNNTDDVDAGDQDYQTDGSGETDDQLYDADYRHDGTSSDSSTSDF
ncbi:uncharacterized protein BO97DRAFT_428971 [Aspergillus homomorphus CBS 101889]|uniref:Uncharacterized protein n=1 Tax=Aspergillus homomorphus (strain CBS 101889) TaxID=1450537 RepID=A0A395HLR8_ASPHC|nr:hypothetical protein BO97DRAFT_428971 [Aspergillus homomorphus CBS 101889]RAL07818.1 hypothetical protein BO97DRAFT_428971 [Aspergillus homomorphus CBS 101889]